MEVADTARFEDSLAGMTIVVAATASISIYRLPDIVRDLRREGARVIVGMSREAAEFVNPEVMRWASENDVITRITGEIEHISKFIGHSKNTMLLACPASYNFIGKAASGISDDVPSLFFSFAFGNGNPVVIAPVMHQSMMENPVNSENLRKLEGYGATIIPPRLEEQKAKISESDSILDYVSRGFNGSPLRGKRILVIGGRGEEPIDPVRSITNSGTGLTASWFLRNAFRLGSERIVFIGNMDFSIPAYVEYHGASRMDDYEKTTEKLLAGDRYDIVINVASLSDFELEQRFSEKLDSSASLDLHLKPRKKLNEIVRQHHKGPLVVFKLSKDAKAEEIRSAFAGIKPDLIIHNPYSDGTRPFGTVKNAYSVILQDSQEDLGTMTKGQMTMKILKLMADKMG